MIFFYCIFHLNIAYSSIEEVRRSDIVRCCYWPLLRLAAKYDLPIGIEATGYTLELIRELDPDWLAELRRLVNEGPCEFVGSGYAQVIGPLVPAEVNKANQQLGLQAYEDLLGLRPRLALVNEQAYSAGMVQHYMESGYDGIVMEWDNPYRSHLDWNPEWRYLPQFACGQHGEKIPLIWNNAIAFQKFQRYAHAEIGATEYREYLSSHLSDQTRVLSLYGNDVEIFNFRPERYHTEADLQEDEWQRIGRLFETLLADDHFRFVRPGKTLELLRVPGAGNCLYLESPDQPIPVKKQGKYNISRWAVTGRGDLEINTACWRIFESLSKDQTPDDGAWRELCYLWSSDFRTHITEKRWETYKNRLSAFEKRVVCDEFRPRLITDGELRSDLSGEMPDDVHVLRERSYLIIQTRGIHIRLNTRRGLAIDALWFKETCDDWMCGTMQHGYYDDINWGADYYTGHLVLESPGHRRITDLEPVESYAVSCEESTGAVMIQARIPLECGMLDKVLQINGRDKSPHVDLEYQINWEEPMAGSLRLGYITLNPDVFSQPDLFFETHNGGYSLERFAMDRSINHGEAVSFLVSARHVIGCTGSVMRLGDHRHYLDVIVDKTASALAGMITYQKVGGSYICRLAWSAQEMDDTSRTPTDGVKPTVCSIRVYGGKADSAMSR